MGTSQQQQTAQAHGFTAADGLAWFMNVSSAVTIVFVNKVLMDPRKGYAFTYACTLSAIHFLTAAACVSLAQMLGLASKARMPWKPTLYFSVVAVISIASLNLSLLVNPVGLYQVAKLLVIPFVCAVEALWFGRRFNEATVCSIIAVIVGVAVVTINDLGAGSTSALGVLVAAVSVAGSGMQQILCGHMQQAYKLQSHQLLAATAPVQGAMLLLTGPWIDAVVSGNWIGNYTLSTPAAAVLVLSSAIAVGVNVSQFMCLGRFSAVTFQVLGHTKTVLVLLISWLALGENMSVRKLLGMALAVAGMVAYGCFASSGGAARPPAVPKASKPGGAASDGGAAATAAHAMELGAAAGAKGGKPAAASAADLAEMQEPLLRNVSREHSDWANASVQVVQVQRERGGG